MSDPNLLSGMNLHKNESEEFHWVVNGKNSSDLYSEFSVNLVGHRCNGSCNEVIDEKPVEKTERLWSNPESWTSKKVPLEDEDVHVESGWNMIMDLAVTPKFKMVRINGKLTFKNDTSHHFSAKHIFIRAGELHIGSHNQSFPHNVTITLYGEKESDAIVYDNAIEAGNKLIANVNKVFIYGKPRKQTLTRLT